MRSSSVPLRRFLGSAPSVRPARCALTSLLASVCLAAFPILGGDVTLSSGGAPLAAQAAEEATRRYLLQRDSLWGYIDGSGQWAIEPRFPGAFPFTEGLAGVQDPESGAWGFIGPDGAWVIEPRFGGGEYAFQVAAAVEPFSEGLAPVQLGTMQEPRLGMIDPQGTVVLEGDWDELYGFSEGLARAAQEDRYGYIDRSGEWAIQPTFEEAGQFSDGLAPAQLEFGEDYGYIDETGEWAIEPAYRQAERFGDGRAPVTVRFDERYIDSDGDVAIEGPFDRVQPFSEGLAPAKPEDRDGFVFLRPDGSVAIDSVDGRALCYAQGFHHGAARVWVPPPGESCGGYAVLGGGRPAVNVDNGLVAYIDRDGIPFYMQPLEELRAAQAREDSIQAARQAAERAEEEAEDRAERERLAACPDLAVYGDSAAPNWIEIGYRGKAARFYFSDLVVEPDGSGGFDVTPPAFHKAGGMGGMGGITLQGISVERSGAGYDAVVNGYGTTSEFCIMFPEALADDFDSEGSAEILRSPGPEGQGPWAANVQIVSDEDAQNYLRAHFETDALATDPEEPPALESYGTWEGRPVTEADFTYDPAQDALGYRYSYETAGGAVGGSSGYVGDFTGEPGIYRRLQGAGEEERVVIHHVTDFSDELVRVEVYETPLEAPTEEEQRSFFETTEADLREYDPEDAERIGTLRSNRLALDRSLEPVVYREDGTVGEEEDEAPRPGSLAPEDFSAGAAPALRGVEPYDLAYTLRFPEAPDRRYRAAAGPAEEGRYRLTVEFEGADVPPEVAEVVRLIAAYEAAEEAVEGGAGVEAVREDLAAVMDDVEMPYDAEAFAAAEDFGSLSQILFITVQERYSEEVLMAATEVAERGAGGEPPLPVMVEVDAETGRPLRARRVFTGRSGRLVEGLGDTLAAVQIEYRDGEAVVTAENELQGRQQKSFPVPEGTLDLFQLRHALAFLPLEDGYRTEIPLFDLTASVLMEASYSTEGGGTASAAVKLRPLYSRATIDVQGREPVETDGGSTRAWRVAVTLEGEPRPLPGLDAVADLTEGWPLEVTYWLRADAPHEVLRAEYPGGATLVRRAP